MNNYVMISLFQRVDDFHLLSAVMWQQVSPATCNQIVSDKVLTLPSVRHLRRLTSASDVNLVLSVSTIMPKYLYGNLIMDKCIVNKMYIPHGKCFLFFIFQLIFHNI